MLSEVIFDDDNRSPVNGSNEPTSPMSSATQPAPVAATSNVLSSSSSNTSISNAATVNGSLDKTSAGAVCATTSATINITSNLASSATGGRPATLPISSPFGPPSDANLATMVKSSTTGDLNATGLLATLATPKNTPLDSMKEWTDTFYKCTLQYVNERLGKCPRTVDAPLEGEIDRLRETQRKYQQILDTCRHMIKVYATLVRQQQFMCKAFGDLGAREGKRSDAGPGLKTGVTGSVGNASNVTNGASVSTGSVSNAALSLTVDFRQNADMFRSMAKSGEKLVLALRFFCSNLDTVANKTIADTILTIKSYENSRLEYDAEKNAVANLLPAQAASANNTEKLISSKAKFERLRDDVAIKIQFLEENKAKVMHKQLILLHNAFAAYASGNESSLENTLKQFSIKAPAPESWLEK
jgi:hypothetical protein